MSGQHSVMADQVALWSDKVQAAIKKLFSSLRVTMQVHPSESLARESIYSQPVTGCKFGVRAKIYMASHKPIIVRVLC